MKALSKSLAVGALIAATLGVQPASAARQVLFGTTGACNNAFPGGPCTQTSQLVQLDPDTGAVIKVIGPVGFTVNGLAWDRRTQTLYASTAIGDVTFHGLITISPLTGKGRPVNATVHNFGLAGADSPVHSISLDGHGRMVGWYDEFPVGQVTDTFVKIDKKTGVATEFPDTGIDTAANGLSFDEVNYLWNVDAPRSNGAGNPLTQKAYLMDPFTGKPFQSVNLNPPTMAALGDFNPTNNLYYGLSFTPFDPTAPTNIVVVDPRTGAVTTLASTVSNLHTLTFAKVVLDR
jgi:hypothetical protein